MRVCVSTSLKYTRVLRQMMLHNDLKKDAKNYKAAQANNAAVKEAKRQYQSKMSSVTSSDVALSAEKWEQAHCEALKAAEEMFDSLREGDQNLTKTYLEALRNDIDRENESNKHSYDNRLAINDLRRKLAAMEREVEKAKKPSKQDSSEKESPKQEEKSGCIVM